MASRRDGNDVYRQFPNHRFAERRQLQRLRKGRYDRPFRRFGHQYACDEPVSGIRRRTATARRIPLSAQRNGDAQRNQAHRLDHDRESECQLQLPSCHERHQPNQHLLDRQRRLRDRQRRNFATIEIAPAQIVGELSEKRRQYVSGRNIFNQRKVRAERRARSGESFSGGATPPHFFFRDCQ